MPSEPSLRDLVDEWLLLDQNPETRNEIQTLWKRQDAEELERRLKSRIEFGTAGLRGKMEAGWSRMNDLIIFQTSQGLSDYVLDQVDNAKNRGLVVGYDHRHHSEHWAHLTAKVFTLKGFKVYLLKGFNHTPMVPFSVKLMNAACGVMITASHNPKQDNGYKVYWENAVQIISPHDNGISRAILLNAQARLPLGAGIPDESSLILDCTEKLQTAYFDYISTLSHKPKLTDVKFVNTSMHGVGDPFLQEGFRRIGFPLYTPVTAQQNPDPDFPTVSYPNPEEKGALSLALKIAEEQGADYVLAQDPDADRFTAAERRDNGQWIVFTGDQLGAIFASVILEGYKKSRKPLSKVAMVASTVSSKMLESMAKMEGFKFVECLTGFKFIGNTALCLVDQGYEVPFGYEEAIGFMFGSTVRDKDGIAAAVLFVELATSLREQGKGVYDRLRELYERYGFFETRNGYFICNDPNITEKIFGRIRNYVDEASETRPNYPQMLGTLEIRRVIDLTTGFDSGNPPEFRPSLPLSSGHMIQIRAGDTLKEVNLVLTLRTSGTEPKIKYYLEGNGIHQTLVEEFLSKAIDDISINWLQADKYGLARA